MENVRTVAESMFFYTSLLSPFQAKKHWHELYINLREWIFFFPPAPFLFFFSLSPSTDSYCDILGQSEMKDIHAGMQYL